MIKAQECVWETAEEENVREAANTSLRATYDDDTEAIIRGELRQIVPRCRADVEAVKAQLVNFTRKQPCDS